LHSCCLEQRAILTVDAQEQEEHVMPLPIKKILVPVDYSEQSRAALDVACSMARDQQATVIIAHVVEPIQPLAPAAAYADVPVPNMDTQREQLEQVIPSDPAVGFEHQLREGNPSAGIVDLAEKENVDLIVMGTHGRRGLKRVLMGSVAEEVVRRAPCPVLTLKHPLHLVSDEEPAGSSQQAEQAERERSSAEDARDLEHEKLEDYLG
jgi:nucleotide-binding universal stress UspA family protein